MNPDHDSTASTSHKKRKLSDIGDVRENEDAEPGLDVEETCTINRLPIEVMLIII